MNILPKKRWHVRTKDNIARVRRDQAKAEKEDQEKQQKIKLAEQEARTSLLRKRARDRFDNETIVSDPSTTPPRLEHVNFFSQLEDGKVMSHKPNADHEKELKAETEKYEKQIGYLTYLGQDTNEATGKRNWYDVVPDRNSVPSDKGSSSKQREDPLYLMDKLLKKKKKEETPKLNSNFVKHVGKISASNLDKKNDNKLAVLRAERLKREREEKLRAEQLIAKLKGDASPVKVVDEVPRFNLKQKYNSQFNPEIAKQNYNDRYK